MIPRDIRVISTSTAAAPGGHYSQGIEHGGLVFVSGQLPVKADGTHLLHASFDDQCRQAIKNLFEVLTAAGTTSDRVLKVTAYIVGAAHWGAFNAIFAEMFGLHRPARSVVPVKELHYGYVIEIDAVAASRQ